MVCTSGRAVETILRSTLFFSDKNLHARVADPVGFVVGSVRALEMFSPPPSTLLLAEWTGRLGQELFFPPNVGGWPGGRRWLSGRGIVARANFAAALALGRLGTVRQASRSGLRSPRAMAAKDRDGGTRFLRRDLERTERRPNGVCFALASRRGDRLRSRAAQSCGRAVAVAARIPVELTWEL